MVAIYAAFEISARTGSASRPAISVRALRRRTDPFDQAQGEPFDQAQDRQPIAQGSDVKEQCIKCATVNIADVYPSV
jgi:hypothetical protein